MVGKALSMGIEVVEKIVTKPAVWRWSAEILQAAAGVRPDFVVFTASAVAHNEFLVQIRRQMASIPSFMGPSGVYTDPKLSHHQMGADADRLYGCYALQLYDQRLKAGPICSGRTCVHVEKKSGSGCRLSRQLAICRGWFFKRDIGLDWEVMQSAPGCRARG